jgi:hypothetical protein
MLDIRRRWDADALIGAARLAAEIGVDTVFATVCGDDPAVANETIAAFGEQVVAAAHDIEPSH